MENAIIREFAKVFNFFRFFTNQAARWDCTMKTSGFRRSCDTVQYIPLKLMKHQNSKGQDHYAGLGHTFSAIWAYFKQPLLKERIVKKMG